MVCGSLDRDSRVQVTFKPFASEGATQAKSCCNHVTQIFSCNLTVVGHCSCRVTRSHVAAVAEVGITAGLSDWKLGSSPSVFSLLRSYPK